MKGKKCPIHKSTGQFDWSFDQTKWENQVCLSGHGNFCLVNVLCPAVILYPVMVINIISVDNNDEKIIMININDYDNFNKIIIMTINYIY